MRIRICSFTSFVLTCCAASALLFPVRGDAQNAAGRILFVSDRDERVGLYQMNADGTDSSLLREGAGAAAFSPDGSKIAFLWRGPDNGSRDIYVMNADGSGLTQVTESGANPEPHPDFPGQVVIGPESVSFHPLGDRIVFSDQGEIFIARIEGSAAPQQVTTPDMGGLTDKESPVFSRDGQRIVFAGMTETEEEPDSGIFILNWDLYAMNADGAGLTRLTTHAADDLAPGFSHDGTRIVFVRQNDPSGGLSSGGLFTMSSAGGAATKIASDPDLTYLSAGFSPDDSRIVFGANTNTGDGTSAIFTINATGGGLRRLTDTPGYNANPVWGPGEVGSTLRISIVNSKITEGNSGSTEAVFTVRLSSSADQPVNVRVATVNGTATAGEDFTAVSEVITLAPGEMERVVRVAVVGDVEWEAAETFFLDLSEAQGATISVARAAAVIANDDLVPVVPGRLAFVSYSGNSGDIFVMNADGSATYNLTDTPDISEGAPVWSPDGSKIAFVASEGAFWSPHGPTGDIFVISADGSGRTRLTNTPHLSEYSPSWSPDGSQIVFESNGEEEFDGNTIPNHDYQLYVMNADGRGRKQITNGFSGFPMPGKSPSWSSTGKIFFADYRDGAAQILSINPNATGERSLHSVPTDFSDTLSAPAVSPDGSRLAFVQAFRPDEVTEQYDVLLMDADGSNLVKLTDDEAPDHDPAFSPDGTKVVFSSYRDGNVDLYTVEIPGAQQEPALVAGRFAARTPVAAPAPPQRLTSGAGEESDADWDRSNASTVPPAVHVSVSKRVVGEGQKAAVFTVRLAAPATAAISLKFVTADGTAKAGSDYTAVAGTMSFARGQRSKTVRVPITSDRLDEENETFSLTLSSLSDALLASAGGTILDDDRPPRVQIAPVRMAEPASGTAPITFAVRLSAPSARPVTVSYRTTDGTANAPADYTAAAGTLAFAPGETEKTVAMAVHADGATERTESFFLKLDSVVNARGKGLRVRAVVE